ncbi:hypothetical protein [Streptomyces sp. Je 1-332]|uniref:hypothetical protein n=1 Tax=Streptomyces sp. Je 1-332 TaxID=3231270 RepID=UPI003458BD0F
MATAQADTVWAVGCGFSKLTSPLDLDANEREALLQGALDVVRAELPEGMDANAHMPLSEVVPLA